ncbi:MAG: hypothetical protein ABIQ95_01565 [Bdellovibrionia bacterium]
MMRLKRSFIMLAVVLFSTSLHSPIYCLAAEITPFEEQWALEKTEQKSSFLPSTLELFNERQVVVVSGFINELSGPIYRYFYSTVDAVKKDLKMTTTFFLPKTQRFSKNIAAIYQTVLKAYEKEQKPVILLGHSKGATEILHTILLHPELITENKVDKVLLVQGTIQGCSILGDNRLRSPLVPLKRFSEQNFEGVECLEPKFAKEKLDLAFEVFERELVDQYGEVIGLEKRKLISGKIFYVRSVAESKDLSLTTRCLLEMAGNNLNDIGPNDGLLLGEEQEDHRIGRELGLIHEDHNAIAVSSLFGGKSYNDRKAFIRTLVQQAYQAELESLPSAQGLACNVATL